jgi:HEAT repeat protein
MKPCSRLLFTALVVLAMIPQALLAGDPDPEVGGRALSAFTKDLADPDPGVRARATTALGEAGTAAAPAAALLAEALEDDTKPVRDAALVSMASIGAAGLPYLERRLASSDLRMEARMAIDGAGHRAVPLLIALLESGSWRVRSIACAKLRGLGTDATAAREALRARLSDAAAAVRFEAVTALVEISGDGLIDSLARALEDEHAAVRIFALDGIAGLKGDGEKRTAILIEATGSKDWTVRLIAIHGLGEACPETVLRKALADPARLVRMEAATRLARRGGRDQTIADALLTDLRWRGVLGVVTRAFRGRGGHRNLVAFAGPKLPPEPGAEEIARALVALAPHSVPGLVDQLSAESSIARLNAIWLLDQIGGEHVRHLVPLLQSEHRVDRQMAAILLADFEEHRVAAAPILADAFVEMCISNDEDPVIHDWSIRPEQVARATRLLGETVIPHLKAHLETLEEWRRQAVLELIVELSK